MENDINEIEASVSLGNYRLEIVIGEIEYLNRHVYVFKRFWTGRA
jgi:hypothetical protein